MVPILQDEFLMAAGSGAVYIVNNEKKMLKLLMTESINGFTAGKRYILKCLEFK